MYVHDSNALLVCILCTTLISIRASNLWVWKSGYWDTFRESECLEEADNSNTNNEEKVFQR